MQTAAEAKGVDLESILTSDSARKPMRPMGAENVHLLEFSRALARKPELAQQRLVQGFKLDVATGLSYLSPEGEFVYALIDADPKRRRILAMFALDDYLITLSGAEEVEVATFDPLRIFYLRDEHNNGLDTPIYRSQGMILPEGATVYKELKRFLQKGRAASEIKEGIEEAADGYALIDCLGNKSRILMDYGEMSPSKLAQLMFLLKEMEHHAEKNGYEEVNKHKLKIFIADQMRRVSGYKTD